MDIDEFKNSIESGQPLVDLSQYLKALWYDARGDWEQAHKTIQDLPDDNAAWIHAYLHRKEGDQFNAGYWYRRSGRTMPALTLQQEWEQIAKALLNEK